MKMDFSRRTDMSELMDTEVCSFEDFRGCLEDLAVVNRLTFAYRPTLDWYDTLFRERWLTAGRPIRIVDIGSGYGDMLRRVEAWGLKRGIAMELIGVDMNPWSARAATEVSGSAINWVTANAFDFVHVSGVDIVMCSLFTHHLTDTQNVELLKWMDRVTGIGWFINDLHRHPIAYYFFRAAVSLSPWHRFVKHDGPVSIARSFVRRDWQNLLGQAGVEARIKWYFPFRLCVSQIKPHAG